LKAIDASLRQASSAVAAAQSATAVETPFALGSLTDPADTGALRVLVVIPQLTIGGAEKQVVLLAKELHVRGHEVAVATFYSGGALEKPLRAAGIPVFVFEKTSKVGWEVIGGLRRLLAEGGYEVAHSFLWPANWRTRVAGRMAGTPAVLVSTRSLESYLGWYRFLLNRLLDRWSHGVIVNAEALRQHVVREQGLSEHKVRVIRNGLQADRFRSSMSRDEARARLGLPADVPVLGCVGNFKPEKNQEDLLRVLAWIRARGRDARLLLVGGGQREAHLRRLAEEAGVEDAVHLIGETDQVPDYLAAMDIFFNSSTREGCCNAILEAMAASLPVLAYAVGGNPELVLHGVTGYLFPLGAWEEMAQQALSLLGDSERRRALGAAGRRDVEERFGVERSVIDTEELYREILRRARRTAHA
jgi:glycosyltransferase involved in cell wall biosynthesis